MLIALSNIFSESISSSSDSEDMDINTLRMTGTAAFACSN